MRRDDLTRDAENLLSSRYSRRQFLHATGLALALPAMARASDEPARRPKVAAVFTVFQHRSHAHVLLENFLEPYLFNGQRTDPGVEVVSFYADQLPQKEMAQEVSRQYKIPIFKTIEGALCLGGQD